MTSFRNWSRSGKNVAKFGVAKFNVEFGAPAWKFCSIIVGKNMATSVRLSIPYSCRSSNERAKQQQTNDKISALKELISIGFARNSA